MLFILKFWDKKKKRLSCILSSLLSNFIRWEYALSLSKRKCYSSLQGNKRVNVKKIFEFLDKINLFSILKQIIPRLRMRRIQERRMHSISIVDPAFYELFFHRRKVLNIRWGGRIIAREGKKFNLSKGMNGVCRSYHRVYRKLSACERRRAKRPRSKNLLRLN